MFIKYQLPFPCHREETVFMYISKQKENLLAKIALPVVNMDEIRAAGPLLRKEARFHWCPKTEMQADKSTYTAREIYEYEGR